MDGDIIAGNDAERCDFLLLNDYKRVAYLIELKGSDIEHALSQLESTATILRDDLKDYRIRYRLVFSKSRTHDIDSLRFRKFRKKHKAPGEFRYKENELEEDI